MLPDSVLSTTAIRAQFWFPRNIPRRPMIDYEYGGTALNNASDGRRVQVWKGEYIEGEIVLSAETVTPTAVLTVANVVDFGFTFDSNMNVFVAYELENGNAFFYWFDTLISSFRTTQLPSGSRTLRCTIDDNRPLQTGASDVILAYCRAGSLYFRAQRERYQTEHLLNADIGQRSLVQIGMNKAQRMQFLLSTA